MSFEKSLAKRTETRAEKRIFITSHKDLIPSIKRGCELMNIPCSTLYYQAKKKPLEKIQEEMGLRDEIEKICLNFPRYGYRRVTKQLNRTGWVVNHKKVLRIM